jgi:hypothetical protein
MPQLSIFRFAHLGREIPPRGSCRHLTWLGAEGTSRSHFRRAENLEPVPPKRPITETQVRRFWIAISLVLIGIGGSLAAPPLPHHRAYGSVPRRFDRVKRSAVPPTEEGRSSRRKHWTKPAALPHGEPCASTRTRPRPQRPRGSGTHPDGAVAHTESVRSSTVARYTCVIDDESRRPGSAARSESGRSRTSLASRPGTAPKAR